MLLSEFRTILQSDILIEYFLYRDFKATQTIDERHSMVSFPWFPFESIVFN